MLSQQMLEQHPCRPLPASGLLAILGAPWLIDTRSNMLPSSRGLCPSVCVCVCVLSLQKHRGLDLGLTLLQYLILTQ